MTKMYSIYETKSHLSELLRMVKQGLDFIITERGTPIAKVVVYQPEEESFEERIKSLERRGVIIPARGHGPIKPGEKKPGALARFLKDRNRDL